MRRHCFHILLAGAGLCLGCGVLPTQSPMSTSVASNDARTPHELPADQSARACYTTAQELEKSGHLREAILEYERTREYDANYLGIAHRLAILYSRQGDAEHAAKEYQLALSQSKDADLLNDYGYFLYEQGNYPIAEQYLGQALAANPKYQRAGVNLGLVLGAQGRIAESYDAFAKVVSPGEAHSNLGMILARLDRRPEAEQEFRKALELQPDLKQARAGLALLQKPPEDTAGVKLETGTPSAQ